MTPISQTEAPHSNIMGSLLAWLTLEKAAYSLILILAAALRLASLGQPPFSPGEAAQAWSALAMLRGEESLPASGASPLLLSLNWLTFAILQPTETLARLFPAFAGTLLALLPYFLRRELGRTAALFSALLLALSGSLTFWSRSASGESFTLFAGLALIICLSGLRRGLAETSNFQLPTSLFTWLSWTAASLALLLLGAPTSYSLLILLAPLALLWLPISRNRKPDEEDVQTWRQPILLFLALILLGSTAFFLIPGGLAALADLPAAWLRQFGQSQGYAWGWLWLEFLVGEPLLSAAGLAGLAVALQRRQDEAAAGQQRFWLGLAFWILLGLLLSALRAGRTPADVTLVVLPLALLGGQSLAALLAWIDPRDWSLDATALLAGGLAIIASVGVWLASYAGTGRSQAESVFLISAAGSLLLMAIVFLAYALLFNHKITLQIILILLAVTLLFPALRHTMAANHNRDGLRWGSLLHTMGASDGPNLTAFLARIAREQGSDLRDLTVGLIVDPGSDVSPLLRWYLREANVQETAGGLGAGGAVLVSMAGRVPSLTSFSGQSFRLTQSWSPDSLSGALPRWRWVLYDHFQDLANEERAVIWVQSGD